MQRWSGLVATASLSTRLRYLRVRPAIAHVRVNIAISEDERVVTLAVEGELDLSTASVLADLPVDLAGRDLVLDLSDVSFMDAAGVSAIVSLMSATETSGGRFRTRGAGGLVSRVLEIVGLGHILSDHDVWTHPQIATPD
jgi:anti-anti-sigma factor